MLASVIQQNNNLGGEGEEFTVVICKFQKSFKGM